MHPKTCLPLPEPYSSDDAYVNDLLAFVTSHELFRMLCGGVHILDFFTLDPPLYESLLAEDWRQWFAQHELNGLLDFVLREDLAPFRDPVAAADTWRMKPTPPASLVEYLAKIRSLKLVRDLPTSINDAGQPLHSDQISSAPRSLALGQGTKKLHEVEHFARFVRDLSEDLSAHTDRSMSHIVDFGSGQNYLGRTLASHPYNKHVIAVESKHDNVERAREMDVSAKLAAKTAPPRNKKKFRRYVEEKAEREGRELKDVMNEALKEDRERQKEKKEAFERQTADDLKSEQQVAVHEVTRSDGHMVRAKLDHVEDGTGSIQYVEHRLENGNLASVIDEIAVDPLVEKSQLRRADSNDQKVDPNLLVVSIHSCGNLSHHGIRSLTMNPSVTAVALVGCCYNLVTERLTFPSYKLPSLRTLQQPIVKSNGNTHSTDTHEDSRSLSSDKSARCAGGDEHGFPMSDRLCNYVSAQGRGVHLNITARMMSLQAPKNWEAHGKDTFFTRHFYRALLQRIFVDRGIVEPSTQDDNGDHRTAKGHAPETRKGASTQAVIIGSLRKTAYTSFVSYVRAAVSKLSTPSNHHPTLACTSLAQVIVDKMAGLTDADIEAYEAEYAPRQKDLSIVWTLMAYSAQVVEAVMVVDRWLWLKEQEEVETCWVQNVFDYSKSPRNLVVVGIKKTRAFNHPVSGPGAGK